MLADLLRLMDCDLLMLCERFTDSRDTLLDVDSRRDSILLALPLLLLD